MVRDANSDLPLKKSGRLFLWLPLKSSWCWGCLRRELIFSYFTQTETGTKKTGIKSCKFTCRVTPNILRESVQSANTHKATLKSHLHLWASPKQREMNSCTRRADALSKHGTLVKSIFIMCVGHGQSQVLVLLRGEHSTDSQAVATFQLLFFVFRDRWVMCFSLVPFIFTSTKWIVLCDLRMWVGNSFSFHSML